MSLLYSCSFNHQDGELRKNQEFTELNHRSSPTSFLDSVFSDDFRYFRSCSPEMARFVQVEYGERSEVKQEMEDSGQMAYQSVAVAVNNDDTAMANSLNYGSNLITQNSSPPGYFSNQAFENGGFREDILDEKAASTTSPHQSNMNFHSSNVFKRLRDNNNDDFGISFSGNTLTHHHSLPNTASEMATIHKFLKFQGSPCKIRAKRGFATHPRSIAERVRRTRISERMRKLQDLFPNLDKQSNTADMLDMAVEYIKDLQKEVKNLADIRSKCRC